MADRGRPAEPGGLALAFTACHPLLSREARVALTLRVICGLTSEEIARAFAVYVIFTEGSS